MISDTFINRRKVLLATLQQNVIILFDCESCAG